jgi:hypothetical protein
MKISGKIVDGGMAEWLKAAVLKSDPAQANPEASQQLAAVLGLTWFHAFLPRLTAP